MTSIIYLHGFASSPGSSKAQDMARRFELHYGLTLRIPDLNVPSFEELTLSAMLRRVAAEVRDCPPGPVYLIGSSMGGLAALHFVDTYRATEGGRVNRLLLLAPAFDFMDNRRQQDAEMLDQWRSAGQLHFFNYATGDERPVHYGLIEDVQRYDSYSVTVDMPVLIFHGQRDASVSIDQSRRFAADRPNVELHEVDSDHQLLDQVDVIWQAMGEFFSLGEFRNSSD